MSGSDPTDNSSDAPAKDTTSGEATSPGTSTASNKSGKPPVPPAAKRKAEIREKSRKGGTRSRTPVKIGSPQWLLPLMLALFVIGIVWIVAYYVAPEAPWISTLGWWNVVIGFGFLAAGFVVATRWR